jgi:hypothetical protein
MADEMKQLPAPENRGSEDWLLPVLVFFGAFVIMLLLVLGNQPAAPDALTIADRSEGEPSVRFLEPEDGAEVPTTFTVTFEAVNLAVEPAGEIHEGAGHFHILIDTPFIEAGEIIPPNDEAHRHFGDGSLSTELTLEPGTYTLRLQFADGAHRALEGDAYRDEITITVAGE